MMIKSMGLDLFLIPHTKLVAEHVGDLKEKSNTIRLAECYCDDLGYGKNVFNSREY